MPDSNIRVGVETPKNSRVKFKFQKHGGNFIVDRVLPPGLRFPFNFGFVPGTQAADGDPTDVILILDEVLFPGCVVDCSLLGVVEATQREKGIRYRDDRILARSTKDSGAPNTLNDLPADYALNVGRLFEAYQAAEGNEFKSVAAQRTR